MTKKRLNFSLVRKARLYAIKAHGDQMYGDKPYVYHLDAVVANLQHRLSKHYHVDVYTLVAAYLHDVVEDTAKTIDDIRKDFGVIVAETVRNVTKIEGMTREQQIAQAKTSMRSRVLKIADSLANLLESIAAGSQTRVAKYTANLRELHEA